MKASKPISPFSLSSLLRRENDPKVALKLFQNPNPDSDPKTQKPFRHSLLSYDLIITKLGRAKMFDQMQQILHQLKQETRFAPPEIIFCNVISFYGRARQSNHALQVFDEMPSFRCWRTVKSFNSLLNALFNCREFEKMKLLYEIIEDYVAPDACTYNIMMKACEDMKDAWKVFDEMLVKGVRPSAVTLGTLIHKLCSNFRVKEAFELKDHMMRVYGVLPNVFVYTSLMKGLCEIGELTLALRLKEEMVIKKVKLDSGVYSTLISALLKAGRKEEASGFLKEMSECGCKPDTVTYNVMIDGFCKEKDFEEAYRVLDKMAEKGCKPDVISYNVIIRALCKEGKWSEANLLFQDLPRRGCNPDEVSYRALFCGLCDCREFKEAAFILDEMIFKGYKPYYPQAHKLVEGIIQEGNLELLWTVLASLENVNVLHLDTWTMLISTVCKEKLSNVSELVDGLTLQ